MTKSASLWAYSISLVVLATLGWAFVGPAALNLPSVLAQDKKDKEGDKGKDKGKPLPEKKKELPKDKTAPLKELKGHKDWIFTASFSTDGKYVITASRDKTVKVWDLKEGKDIATFKDNPGEVRTALLTPDGKQAITTTGKWDKKKKKEEKKDEKFEGEIRVWDVKSGKMERSFKGHSSFILCGALSTDGKLLATGSEDQTAIIWDVKEGKALQTLKSHKTKINTVAFSKDGTKLITGSTLPIYPDPKKAPKAGEDVLIKVWTVADGKEVTLPNPLKGPERDVSSVAFSPDGKYIAAGSWDGKIYLWDKDGKLAKKLEAQEGVLSINFSHDGKFLAASGWEDTTKVWDVEAGKELFYRNGHKNSVTGVLFSPDDQRFVTVGIDQTVKVWEMPKK